MAAYFLGVDGGQSSTTALVGDAQGRIVGSARGGPCNHVSGPEARGRFLNAIGGAVREAASQAGLSILHFEAACLGFSGGAQDKEPLLDEIFTATQRFVTNDGLIAVAGAHAGGPGVIVVAGTGSIAYGRNAAGRTARAGGWGYIYGDEGGGFDTTRQALRAALRMEEGWGPETTLRAKLLEAGAASSINDLMHRFYTPEFPRPHIASFSRLVDDAAEEGDAIAQSILVTQAERLVEYGEAVRRVLFTAGEIVGFCPVGSVYRSRILRDAFERLITASPFHRVHDPIHGPAAGALLEAYRLAGLGVNLSNLPESEK